MLAGKPNADTFPFTSFSFTANDPTHRQGASSTSEPPSSITSGSNAPGQLHITIPPAQLAAALQYGPTTGLPDLISWVYTLQAAQHGRYKGEGWRVSIGTGSQDLLYKSFSAFVNPGDAVLIEAPAYAGVVPMLKSARCKLVEVPTDGQGIQASKLRITDSGIRCLSGLRIGFVSGPSYVLDKIDLHTAAANLQTSSFTQVITHALLAEWGFPKFDAHIAHVSAFYKQKRDVFEAAMKRRLAGLAEWDTPQAGMFFWFKLKLPSVLDGEDGDSERLIREKAVEHGILALPGTAFYPNGEKSAFVRAAFSLLSPEDVDEGLRRLAEVITA
ncbi:hypothetical protein FRC06_009603 [Ceratobasidium sp. 370]|nr:hypothetical protein FRC06_009603 [Ceratobasidium sp. 370]